MTHPPSGPSSPPPPPGPKQKIDPNTEQGKAAIGRLTQVLAELKLEVAQRDAQQVRAA